MAKELVAQPLSLVSTFDQSGDIGDNEIKVIKLYHAQVRL